MVYDPRERPWYTKVKNEKKSTWSDAYIFFSGDQKTLGLTSAAPVFGADKQLLGVFGVDVSLAEISKFLAKQQVSENGLSFIVDQHDMIIAYPHLKTLYEKTGEWGKLIDIHKLPSVWLLQSYNEYQKTKMTNFSYEYNGENYLAAYNNVPRFLDKKWKIAIIAPEDDFVGVVREAQFITIAISVGVLLLGILLILNVSRRISVPIKKLALETKEITMFNFQQKTRLHSRIKEVDLMSEALEAMRNSLISFERYVPSTLVKRLVKTGKVAKLGGSKTEITAFFTDIENFTSISEQISPEDMMVYLCDYFDEMTKIILAKEGTVDKYIGDAIMAFWGAPIEDEDHCLHACEAALQYQARLKDLNKTWSEQNRPELKARIGIQTGDAVVGNVGSSERINYTAIGDTVNTASRFESINKVYGTHIIISEDVVQKIGDGLYLRKLDCVAVKGKEESMNIYELVGKMGDSVDEEIKRYCDEFDGGLKAYGKQQWDESIRLFKAYQSAFPSDNAAQVFIERCEHFKEHRPEDCWCGVWHFKTK